MSNDLIDPSQLNTYFPIIQHAVRNCSSYLSSINPINKEFRDCVSAQFKREGHISIIANSIFNQQPNPLFPLPTTENNLKQITYVTQGVTQGVNRAAIDTMKAYVDTPATHTLTENLITRVIKHPLSFALPIVPWLLWKLYRSKETHINLIKLNIRCLPQNKRYRISLRRNSTTVSTVFEVAAGRPLQLQKYLNNSSKCNDAYSELAASYNTGVSSYRSALMKPFSPLIWGRKDHYTILQIKISDTAYNDSLNNGPITYSSHFSNKDRIDIIHTQENFNHHEAISMSEEEIFQVPRLTKHDASIDFCATNEKNTYIIPLLSTSGTISETLQIEHS